MTIELYDATLRDGMGGAGISLTADEKLRLVHKLDELGIHLVEAGFPSSNPKEAELFRLLERETFERVTGPGSPVPTGWSSISRSGVSSAAVPVMKLSSAR